MKGFLLSAVALLSVAGSVNAQTQTWRNRPPERRWDVGINYGTSTISRPLGPEKNYSGSRTEFVQDMSIKVIYGINENWNVNFDLGWRKWEAFGTWSNPYTFGSSLKNTGITIGIGSPALTESVQLNYTLTKYDKYKGYVKSYFYAGALAGLVTTVSDGSTGYSHYNSLPDSNYRYISSYNYGAGIGYSLGLQLGYTYYFAPRFGVNVELGARYVNMTTMTTNDVADNHGTTKYQMVFLPETIGLRYRIK